MPTPLSSRPPPQPPLRVVRVATLAGAVALALTAPMAAAQTAAQPGASAPTQAGSRTPGPRLDLLTLLGDAMANDSQFAAARAQYQATIEREPQARAGLLPTLNLSANRARNFPDLRQAINVAGGTIVIAGSQTFNTYGEGLSLAMPLYRPQNWEALEQAKLTVAQGQSILAQAQQDLLLRLSTAYFNVLAAQDQVQALEVSKAATLQQLAQARREFEVGTKTIVDTNEAQALADQIDAQLQVARGQLLVRRSELTSIIGHPPDELATLSEAPSLTPPQPNDIGAWVNSAQDTNHAVETARVALEVAKREVQRAKDGHKPTLDLSATYNINHTQGTAFSNLDSRSRVGVVSLLFNMPLYSGGLTQSRVRETLQLQQKADSDLETARRSAANAARTSFTGVDFGLAQVRALESAERSARTQLESTRVGYQVGVRIQLDVLNATTQLASTQRDLKKARYDFLLNGLSLKAAAGALSEDDLRAVNALLQR